MTTKNKSRYAILGVLSYGPSSGYDIKKSLENSVNYFWSESYGQIYPILKQLVQSKLATQKTTQSAGGRKKILYSITIKGRKELKAWLAKPVEFNPIRDELLLKLFFGWHVTSDISLSHIQRARTEFHQTLAFLTNKAKQLAKEYSQHRALNYWLITLNNGIAAYQASVEWCDKTEKTLKRAKT